jgi:hypothetical protein
MLHENNLYNFGQNSLFADIYFIWHCFALHPLSYTVGLLEANSILPIYHSIIQEYSV